MYLKLDPDLHKKAAVFGSALRKTVVSGYAENESESTALVLGLKFFALLQMLRGAALPGLGRRHVEGDITIGRTL